jgi:hypothetical protein
MEANLMPLLVVVVMVVAVVVLVKAAAVDPVILWGQGPFHLLLLMSG